MRFIASSEISNAVKNLIINSSVNLPEDTYSGIQRALKKEISDTGKATLSQILLNADIAKTETSPCVRTLVLPFFSWK